VWAPGHGENVYEIDLRRGEAQTLEVRPGRSDAEAAARAARGERRRAAWIVGGAGVVTLGLGIAGGLVVMGLKDRTNRCDVCPADVAADVQDARSQALAWSWISTLGIGAGALALGVSSYLFVTSSEPRILPVVGPNSAGITLGGRFR
jgi:hypothetical protein